jgi:hypothetical protein
MMSANEIALVAQQYRARLEAILTPELLERFDAYERRIQAAIEQRDSRPVEPTPEEQALLDTIAADTEAAALQARLDIVLRIRTSRQ